MWRRSLRFLGLFALAGLGLPVALLARALTLLGARTSALRLAAATQALWGRGVLRVLGVELVLEGSPPPGTFLVVANHLSYLDIPLLAALFPGRFVAKSEIAGWPVLGQLAQAAGTIFVVQKKQRDLMRVEREMRATLAAGVSVLLFPEGRSTRGQGIERLHSSLLECAVHGGIPCLAVALRYETPTSPWAPASTVCWWGGMGFWRHAWGLVGLERIEARVHVAHTARCGDERKALAAALRSDLEAGFRPVRQEPIAPDTPWPELFGVLPGNGPPAHGAARGAGVACEPASSTLATEAPVPFDRESR